MATNFPTAIDNFPNPTSADKLDTVLVLHSTQHSNMNDAIEAIEAKLGVNLSSVENSIDYIVKTLLLTQQESSSGRYREISYHPTIAVLPETITWYLDGTKLVKLVEKQYTYGGTIAVLPTVITLRMFDGTNSNNILRTIADVVTYNKIFEVSRVRTVS